MGCCRHGILGVQVTGTLQDSIPTGGLRDTGCLDGGNCETIFAILSLPSPRLAMPNTRLRRP